MAAVNLFFVSALLALLVGGGLGAEPVEIGEAALGHRNLALQHLHTPYEKLSNTIYPLGDQTNMFYHGPREEWMAEMTTPDIPEKKEAMAEYLLHATPPTEYPRFLTSTPHSRIHHRPNFKQLSASKAIRKHLKPYLKYRFNKLPYKAMESDEWMQPNTFRFLRSIETGLTNSQAVHGATHSNFPKRHDGKAAQKASGLHLGSKYFVLSTPNLVNKDGRVVLIPKRRLPHAHSPLLYKLVMVADSPNSKTPVRTGSNKSALLGIVQFKSGNHFPRPSIHVPHVHDPECGKKNSLTGGCSKLLAKVEAISKHPAGRTAHVVKREISPLVAGEKLEQSRALNDSSYPEITPSEFRKAVHDASVKVNKALQTGLGCENGTHCGPTEEENTGENLKPEQKTNQTTERSCEQGATGCSTASTKRVGDVIVKRGEQDPESIAAEANGSICVGEKCMGASGNGTTNTTGSGEKPEHRPLVGHTTTTTTKKPCVKPPQAAPPSVEVFTYDPEYFAIKFYFVVGELIGFTMFSFFLTVLFFILLKMYQNKEHRCLLTFGIISYVIAALVLSYNVYKGVGILKV